MAPKVLIVDDHPTFRSMARVLLVEDGFDVVGVARDGAAGLAAARELSPDIVLVDVRLPDRDGFSVAAELCGAADPAGEAAPVVVVMSSSDDPRYPELAVRSGAAGFMAKHDLGGPLLKSLFA